MRCNLCSHNAIYLIIPMHQYNCILQQRRGGMENKSSLGGAARWNNFEIFGMKIYFVQEVTRPILVFYSHTCCWLFLPSHFSSLLPFPLLFWKTFNLLCFCHFIPMLHNLSCKLIIFTSKHFISGRCFTFSCPPTSPFTFTFTNVKIYPILQFFSLRLMLFIFFCILISSFPFTII